jgi:molybdopterin converting factor small subunit
MIHVKVRFFPQAVPEQVELELEAGSSVETLLMRVRERVGRDSAKVAFFRKPDQMIVLLNGRVIHASAGWKTPLQEGDEVSFLPPMAGG